MPRLKWTSRLILQARELAEQGCTLRQAAEKLNLTYDQIERLASYHKVGFTREPFRYWGRK